MNVHNTHHVCSAFFFNICIFIVVDEEELIRGTGLSVEVGGAVMITNAHIHERGEMETHTGTSKQKQKTEGKHDIDAKQEPQNVAYFEHTHTLGKWIIFIKNIGSRGFEFQPPLTN